MQTGNTKPSAVISGSSELIATIASATSVDEAIKLLALSISAILPVSYTHLTLPTILLV